MTDQEASLQQLLRFSGADLAANRDGRLGPGQVPRLVWSGVWRLLVGAALGVASLAITLALLGVPLASVATLLLAGFGLVLTWQGFGFVVDAIEGGVAFVTAPLEPRVVRGKSTTYYAGCGPVSKTISARTYDELPRGLTCHLYYAPGSRSLLAIEPSSESEPKPAHPFGPDSAHVWDRLRVSWVAITIGVVGILVGVQGIATAHPAHAIAVEGTVAGYSETHGKSTHRYLYMTGDPSAYTPYAEDSYGPPVPSFDSLTGRSVVLYVNEGTRDVLAINDGEQLHASDWYLYPDHQTRFEIETSAITVAIWFLVAAAGVVAIVYGPRIAARARQSAQVAPPQIVDPAYASTPMYSMPNLYAPPTVHPLRPTLVAGLALVFVLTAVGLSAGLLLALATQR